MEFTPFQKIPRLRRDCIITEKIDGTNASIYIIDINEHNYPVLDGAIAAQGDLVMYAGSRNKWIQPGKADNAGFASWCVEHEKELFQLGKGRHFGEWWGGKIQRGYGVPKQFSLFHDGGIEHKPDCVSIVPQLYVGPFSDVAVDEALAKLKLYGSIAAPGFMNPEGIVIYLMASRQLYKVTLDNDAQPKGVVNG